MKPTSKSTVVRAILAAKEDMRNAFWSDHLRIEYCGSVHVVSRKKVEDWCTEHGVDYGPNGYLRYMHAHYGLDTEKVPTLVGMAYPN